MTRRITRAKQSIKDSGVPFALPAPDDLAGRLEAVLRVLYLIFNEGYASTAGTELVRVDLAEEAIRLARMLHAARPEDSEVTGLLALMLLVHARHRARTAPDGSLIPMADQDRSLWDRGAIDEGIALITAALPRGPTGPYQLQAAIAAVHDEAAERRGHRLAPDRRPLRRAAPPGRQPGRRAQPRRRRQHGRRAPGGPRTAPAPGRRRPGQRRPSLPCGPRPPARDGWRPPPPRSRRTGPRPERPRTSSSSATSISRSPACRTARELRADLSARRDRAGSCRDLPGRSHRASRNLGYYSSHKTAL